MRAGILLGPGVARGVFPTCVGVDRTGGGPPPLVVATGGVLLATGTPCRLATSQYQRSTLVATTGLRCVHRGSATDKSVLFRGMVVVFPRRGGGPPPPGIVPT